MRILIAGTGAMGASFGSLLKNSGNEVVFLDNWDKNIESIRNNGIIFNNINKEEKISTDIYRPNEYNSSCDLILLFTKSMQLESMLSDIKHIIKDNTMILCMLNGLGHIDTLKKYFDESRIIMGITTLTASMSGAGNFKCTSYGNTEIQGLVDSSNAKLVIDCFNKANIPTVYSDNILYSIWKKACVNGTMNSLCTILDCNMRTLGKTDNFYEILRNIISEFSAVAKFENINLNVDEITDFCYSLTSENFSASTHYPSMHQDLIQNNRKTEIDFLNGYISRKAKQYGIETKYCDLITYLVHAKEFILIQQKS